MHVSIMHVHWGREIKTVASLLSKYISSIRSLCICFELFTQFIVYSPLLFISYAVFFCFQYPFRLVSISSFSFIFFLPSKFQSVLFFFLSLEHCVTLDSASIKNSFFFSFCHTNFLICIFPLNGRIEYENIHRLYYKK